MTDRRLGFAFWKGKHATLHLTQSCGKRYDDGILKYHFIFIRKGGSSSCSIWLCVFRWIVRVNCPSIPSTRAMFGDCSEITPEGRRITKLEQILLNGNNIAIVSLLII